MVTMLHLGQRNTNLLQRQFDVRTALTVISSGPSATFVLPQSHPNPELSL